MISNEEVKNLAGLARVALSAEEEVKLTGELGQILAYVGELQKAGGEVGDLDLGENKNQLREDNLVEENNTEILADNLKRGEFVRVKKIL